MIWIGFLFLLFVGVISFIYGSVFFWLILAFKHHLGSHYGLFSIVFYVISGLSLYFAWAYGPIFVGIR